MIDEVERIYRQALRWYPQNWRSRHGDVMISTLLDIADAEGRTRVSHIQLLNLVSSGLAERARTDFPSWARQALSTAALGIGFALAVASLVATSGPAWASLAPWVGSGYRSFGPFADPGVLVYSLWLVAGVLLVTGQVRALRLVMVLAAITAIAVPAMNHFLGNLWLGPSLSTMSLFALLAVCVTIGTPQPRIVILAPLIFSAWGVVYCLALYSPKVEGGAYLAARYFWRTGTPGYVFALVIMSLFVLAVAYSLARRPEAAATCLASVALWVSVVAGESIRHGMLPLVLIIVSTTLAILIVGYVCRLALLRFQETVRSNSNVTTQL